MYAVSRSKRVDRKEGLVRKAKLDPEEFKTAVRADALKAAISQHWDNMSREYICNRCKAFRGRLEAIIAANGGYIND